MRIPLTVVKLGIAAVAWSVLAWADIATPYPGTRVVKSPHPYPVLVQRLERAIAANGLGLVAPVIEKIAADAVAK
ncbi:MAG: hypothetical protein AB1768_15745 [Pseudomonadota bacterium]|jgi:hypothetical protein